LFKGARYLSKSAIKQISGFDLLMTHSF